MKHVIVALIFTSRIVIAPSSTHSNDNLTETEPINTSDRFEQAEELLAQNKEFGRVSEISIAPFDPLQGFAKTDQEIVALPIIKCLADQAALDIFKAEDLQNLGQSLPKTLKMARAAACYNQLALESEQALLDLTTAMKSVIGNLDQAAKSVAKINQLTYFKLSDRDAELKLGVLQIILTPLSSQGRLTIRFPFYHCSMGSPHFLKNLAGDRASTQRFGVYAQLAKVLFYANWFGFRPARLEPNSFVLPFGDNPKVILATLPIGPSTIDKDSLDALASRITLKDPPIDKAFLNDVLPWELEQASLLRQLILKLELHAIGVPDALLTDDIDKLFVEQYTAENLATYLGVDLESKSSVEQCKAESVRQFVKHVHLLFASKAGDGSVLELVKITTIFAAFAPKVFNFAVSCLHAVKFDIDIFNNDFIMSFGEHAKAVLSYDEEIKEMVRHRKIAINSSNQKLI